MNTYGKFECWVDVPGTDTRFQISNLGRLRKLGHKVRHGGRFVVEMDIGLKTLVCDYKSGRLGWWLWFDNENHFLARDELMELFPANLRDIDTSADETAVEKRNATFNAEIEGRANKAEDAAKCEQPDENS